jgi:hypothetical protein
VPGVNREGAGLVVLLINGFQNVLRENSSLYLAKLFQTADPLLGLWSTSLADELYIVCLYDPYGPHISTCLNSVCSLFIKEIKDYIILLIMRSHT